MRPLIAGAFLLASMISLVSGVTATRASENCVDVALVLTIDASASVSREEFDLQRGGIAAAFRDAGVLNAISSVGRVAVSAVIWGSEGLPKQRTGWTYIESPGDAERFAAMIGSIPRQVTGDTGLGAGLAVAVKQFDTLGQCSIRKVINVSGDGADTPFVRRARVWPAPSQVRAIAESKNVEINALAITNEEIDLPAYYASNVITGPDAFVMQVSNYADIAQALERKLIREISPRQISRQGLEGPFPSSISLERPRT